MTDVQIEYLNKQTFEEYCDAVADQVAGFIKDMGSLDRIVIEPIGPALSVSLDTPREPLLRSVSKAVPLSVVWQQAENEARNGG